MNQIVRFLYEIKCNIPVQGLARQFRLNKATSCLANLKSCHYPYLTAQQGYMSLAGAPIILSCLSLAGFFSPVVSCRKRQATWLSPLVEDTAHRACEKGGSNPVCR